MINDLKLRDVEFCVYNAPLKSEKVEVGGWGLGYTKEAYKPSPVMFMLV